MYGHTERDIQVLNLEMVRLFLKTGPFNGKSKLQAGGAQKLQYSGLPSHILSQPSFNPNPNLN